MEIKVNFTDTAFNDRDIVDIFASREKDKAEITISKQVPVALFSDLMSRAQRAIEAIYGYAEVELDYEGLR